MIISKLQYENRQLRLKSSNTDARSSAESMTAQFAMQAAAIIVLLLLSFALMTAPVFAASDNGADAHARSMSAGSGEEPIDDESTTWDYGQSDESADNDRLSEEAEMFDEEAAEEASDDTEQGSEQNNTASAPDDLSGKIKLVFIAAAALAAAALAAILIIRSMKKRL